MLSFICWDCNVHSRVDSPHAKHMDSMGVWPMAIPWPAISWGLLFFLMRSPLGLWRGCHDGPEPTDRRSPWATPKVKWLILQWRPNHPVGLHCEERGIYQKQAIPAYKLLVTEVAANYFNAAAATVLKRVLYPWQFYLSSLGWVTSVLICCPVGEYIFLVLHNY